MSAERDLVIVGDSAFAEVAFECFTHDSPYRVVGFAVEEGYKTKETLFGLPVVDFEQLPEVFSPKQTSFYAALVYSQLNRLRARLYSKMKGMGYKPVSYISSRAFVWPGTKVGEHCFIFEDNTVQPFVKIGDNTVIWSGNHVGHHSVIGSHCFIASHAVISGFCSVGDRSFIGVNATISNNVKIGEDNWIGLGATITKDTPNDALFKGERSSSAAIGAKQFFRIES